MTEVQAGRGMAALARLRAQAGGVGDGPPPPAPKLRMLAAYPYINGDLAAALAANASRVEMLLDSGAFTAWTLGDIITLDQYCSFLDKLGFEPWRYFMLDVVGDHAATRRNYDAMLARGFKPVPIFTRGTPIQELHDYTASSDLVGMGGLVGGDQTSRYGYLKSVIPKVPGANLHLLGVTATEWIKHFRPYSCDSTSWVSPQRYGRINLYMGRGRIVIYHPKTDGRPTGEIAARIARYGFDPYGIAKKDALWLDLSVMSWVDFSLDMFDAIGTRLHLVVGRESQLMQLLDAHDRMLEIRGREKGRLLR